MEQAPHLEQAIAVDAGQDRDRQDISDRRSSAATVQLAPGGPVEHARIRLLEHARRPAI